MNDRVFKPSEAYKLEDPERLRWLPPQKVVSLIEVRAGMEVADVGAGTGYFAIPLARVVGPTGRVFAVDLQPEMLELLRKKLAAADAPRNVTLIAGSATETHLAKASCDLVLLANVWHELDDPQSAVAEAGRVLKPQGKLVILDWRSDVERPPGPPLEHRIDAEEVRRSAQVHGWSCDAPISVGRYSYIVICRHASSPKRQPVTK